MKKEEKKVEEIVKFIMDKTNSIDDYNWGQDKFEEDVRDKINQLLQEEREKVIEEIEEEFESISGLKNPEELDFTAFYYYNTLQEIKELIKKIKEKQ